MSKIILAGSIAAVVAYLLGSISFAVIVSKIFAKKDVRDYGSGNAGMTNVLRNFGKLPAVFTVLGDFSKGAVAVIIGRLLFKYLAQTDPLYGAYVAGIFVLLGHIFPLYFGFKGGKGVLTSAGIILVIDPIVLLCLLVIFAVAFLLSKMVSVGSISVAIAYPIVTFILHSVWGEDALIYSILAACIGAVVLFMHRSNIKRIINGTESKFDKKKK